MARESNSDDMLTNENKNNLSNSGSGSSGPGSGAFGDPGGNDKLELLFQKQKMLITQELDSTDNDSHKRENKMKRLYQVQEPFQGYRIFMLASALLHETVELQRETDWKWWKSEKGVNHQKVVEEIIDLWHFLIQLSIETGIDTDMLVTKYLEKNRENTKRQESGY